MKFSPKNSKLGPNLKWHFNELHLTISQFCLCSPCKKKKKERKTFFRIESPGIKSCTYGQLIYKKRRQVYTVENTRIYNGVFSIVVLGKLDTFKRMKLEHF